MPILPQRKKRRSDPQISQIDADYKNRNATLIHSESLAFICVNL